ncbi:hypothetical protein [Erythrobacter sp. MTPC3]|uniref:hypothetical protein n=1 Tax=Erythrobacter sp. MTPC3 TaxID=3056564 RepID=UPI0036F3AA15
MSNRQKKADRFYLASTVGAIALFVSLELYVFVNYILLTLPDAMHAPGMLARNLLNLPTLAALAGALITLIVLRNSDEFALAIWNSGTTSGFFMSIIWLFFVPVFLSAQAALSGSSEKPDFDFLIAWGAPVIMAAVFVGLHIKRLRG